MGLGNAIGIGIPTVNLGLGGGSEPVEERFVISVKTDNAGVSDDNQFELAVGNGYTTYDYNIETSDGQVLNNNTGNTRITFPSAGTYQLKITGVLPSLYFQGTTDNQKVTSIINWGTNPWLSLNRSFVGFTNCVINATDLPNLSQCTSLKLAFYQWQSLVNWDVTNLDVSNVTNFEAVFQNCVNLETLEGINNWQIGNLGIDGFKYAFQNCRKLTSTMEDWDVTNIRNIGNMFSNAYLYDNTFGKWNITGDLLSSNRLGGLNAKYLSTPNYDDTLIKWENQLQIAFPNGVGYINTQSINFGNAQYSYEAVSARQTLIDTYGWTITDGGQAVVPEFAIRVQTDATGGISQDNQFIIPTFSGEVYNYIIETSDGQTLTNNTGDTTITFPSSGIYDIKITGLFPRIYFNSVGDGDKLLSILNWGTQQWSSFAKAFSGCIRLDYVDSVSVPDLTNVTDLSQCFNLCHVLGQTQGIMDWSGWDVSNVLTFGNGFLKRYNTSVSDDFTGWSFGIGANLAGAVSNTDRNQAILTNWNLSNVTSIQSVFNGYDVARELIGLETWNTTTITNMKNLFFRGDMVSFGSLANWDLSNVTTFSGMFFGYNATLTDADSINSINNLDVSNATDLSNMFGYANNVLPLVNLSNWNVSNATNMASMFRNCTTIFPVDNLSTWDITGVTNFNGFMSNANCLSVSQYDALLIGWQQTLETAFPSGVGYTPNISITFGGAQYTLGGAAEAARNTLINTYGWTITDGGGLFVGLLDTYPNASAAYSLRDLASESVGSAVVRVRRSSDNTEQDFTAAEITNGTLTTFTGANDGFVATWYDQSGNSNNAAQSTAISQAKIVDGGLLTYIDGTTPSLYFEQSERRHYAFTGASYPISFFAVKKGINNTQTYQYTIGTALTRGLRAVNENYANNTPFAVSNLYVNNQLGETNSLQYHSINYCNATGDNILDRIGTSRTSSAYSTGMYITEFIVYPSDQSANRTGIETNINTEYTIY